MANGEQQFLRIEAFSHKEVSRVLNEATRVPGFCPHVREPGIPFWLVGSKEAVQTAVNAFMATPCVYTKKNGTKAYRKRRSDYRSLIGGVCSWPMDRATMRMLARVDKEAYQRELDRIRIWTKALNSWLGRVFGEHRVGILSHTDESHFHYHFLIVGNAKELHPGLRAEYDNGERIQSPRERRAGYKAAMSNFLDDFYRQVGEPSGLTRGGGGRNKPRIRDYGLAVRVLELERKLKERDDPEIRAVLEQVVRDAPKYVRPRMRF